MLKRRGANSYAIKRLGQEIRRLGYPKVILKSDQEPAIKSHKEAVMDIDVSEIIPEDSPAYEHQSNGTIENAVQRVGGQVRTMKVALENRYRVNIGVDHHILPWLIRYAANILPWYKIGRDGKTAYERLKGRKYRKGVAEFGE